MLFPIFVIFDFEKSVTIIVCVFTLYTYTHQYHSIEDKFSMAYTILNYTLLKKIYFFYRSNKYSYCYILYKSYKHGKHILVCYMFHVFFFFLPSFFSSNFIEGKQKLIHRDIKNIFFFSVSTVSFAQCARYLALIFKIKKLSKVNRIRHFHYIR